MNCISHPETFFRQIFNSNTKLPGLKAWQKLMPFKHPLSQDFETQGLKDAAVLIALYRHQEKWFIPLILRAEDGYHHSGQVSFPGGRVELDEALADCALREAHEEIGINPREVDLLTMLTPIPIHVSGHLVHPFVGILKSKPTWEIDSKEVKEVLEIEVGEFNDQAIRREDWDFPHRGGLCSVPFYYLRDKKIWGATAMILSELMAVIESN